MTSETIKLLLSTENKITKYTNGENVPHFEVAEVILLHGNVGNSDYQKDSIVF